MVIRPQYRRVESFSDGLAIAYKEHRPFYIDRTGSIRISGPYREATAFVHGLAAVLLTENDVAYIDRNGKEVFRYRRQ
jgi:hypothetical protein